MPKTWSSATCNDCAGADVLEGSRQRRELRLALDQAHHRKIGGTPTPVNNSTPIWGTAQTNIGDTLGIKAAFPWGP
jgi:hypothetical protein